MSLLVMVAHNGRTLQLDVQPSTRVDALQQALVTFTGVPVQDQIAMYSGSKLDPSRQLAAYKLPVADVGAAEDAPVFLYCKSYLRPGAPPPPPEQLLPIVAHVPPPLPPNAAADAAHNHPLASATSRAVRDLPVHEARFGHQLSTARALGECAQARMHRCRQLLSEQEVQARAADAARANVELHYAHICHAYSAFMARYMGQHAAHEQLLCSFQQDFAALEAIALHPALQGEMADLPVRLADLPGAARAREWSEHCRRSHQHFATKVSELEALWEGLRRDVEGLFMQAPSVDLDALGAELVELEGALGEQEGIVQLMSNNLRMVQQRVESSVRGLAAEAGQPTSKPVTAAGSQGSGWEGPEGQGMADEDMHAADDARHGAALLRCAAIEEQLAGFEAGCVAAKATMTQDVVSQLQRISSQQSKIRDMKSRLAAFGEVLARQQAAFNELRVVGRLPAAYRGMLAECARRRAWHEVFAGQTAKLADHLARLRDKEQAKRQAFVRQVERFLPPDLLDRAGLAQHLPPASISVPPLSPHLLPVSLSELQQQARASPLATPAHAPPAAIDAALAALAEVMSVPWAGPEGAAEGEGCATLPRPISVPALEMENAKLRMDLASHIAATCAKELQQAQAAAAAAAAGAGAGAGGGAGAGPTVERSGSFRRPSLTVTTAAAGAAVAPAAGGEDQPAGTMPAQHEPAASRGRGSAVGADGSVHSAQPAGGPSASGAALAPGLAPLPGPPTPPVAPAAAAFGGEALALPSPRAPDAPKDAGQQALGLELSTAVQRLLASRDAFSAVVQREMRALHERVAAYEQRIGELEAALSSATVHPQRQQAPEALPSAVHGNVTDHNPGTSDAAPADTHPPLPPLPSSPVPPRPPSAGSMAQPLGPIALAALGNRSHTPGPTLSVYSGGAAEGGGWGSDAALVRRSSMPNVLCHGAGQPQAAGASAARRGGPPGAAGGWAMWGDGTSSTSSASTARGACVAGSAASGMEDEGSDSAGAAATLPAAAAAAAEAQQRGDGGGARRC